MTRIDADALKIEHVERGHRPALRVFGRVGDARYEFVRLTDSAPLEVYDFPSAWDGVSRFLGYAPSEHATKFDAIVSRHARCSEGTA